MRRWPLLAAALCSLWAGPAAAQVVTEMPIGVAAGPLLRPSYRERLFCTRVAAEDAWAIQRRGDGWYRPAVAWDENFPRHFRIETSGQRSVTLTLDAAQRPRLLQVRLPRPDSLGGGSDAIVIRFLPTGAVQEGSRRITPSRRGRSLVPPDMRERPLLGEDGTVAHGLAVELAFRCITGWTEPLPEGWLWTLVRRPL